MDASGPHRDWQLRWNRAVLRPLRARFKAFLPMAPGTPVARLLLFAE